MSDFTVGLKRVVSPKTTSCANVRLKKWLDPAAAVMVTLREASYTPAVMRSACPVFT